MAKLDYGFHGNLEAEAFMAVLTNNKVSFNTHSMESMESKNIDNPEYFEMLVEVDANTIPSLAKDVFDNTFEDFELNSIIDGSFVEADLRHQEFQD